MRPWSETPGRFLSDADARGFSTGPAHFRFRPRTRRDPSRHESRYNLEGGYIAMANEDVERLVSENVSETVWLRLRRLTSAQLCEQLLTARKSPASSELIRTKSVGISSAIRSALGYWDTKEGGLNSKILSRYYALLQITIAEQIA